jgi:hypothetical protein
MGFPCWNDPDGVRSADSITLFLFLFQSVEKRPESPALALSQRLNGRGWVSQPWIQKPGEWEKDCFHLLGLTQPVSWPHLF